MNEHVIEEALIGLLRGWYSFEDTVLPECVECKTFSEAGLLTNNIGVVLAMQDGSEFQLTIVKSKEHSHEYYENLRDVPLV